MPQTLVCIDPKCQTHASVFDQTNIKGKYKVEFLKYKSS